MQFSGSCMEVFDCFVNDNCSGWRRVSSLFAEIYEISVRLPSVAASWTAVRRHQSIATVASTWRVMSRCDLCRVCHTAVGSSAVPCGAGKRNDGTFAGIITTNHVAH